VRPFLIVSTLGPYSESQLAHKRFFYCLLVSFVLLHLADATIDVQTDHRHYQDWQSLPPPQSWYPDSQLPEPYGTFIRLNHAFEMAKRGVSSGFLARLLMMLFVI
jgi:hypothetical protein